MLMGSLEKYNVFKIPKAANPMIDTREQLENHLEEYLPIIKGFTSLECSGNSYSYEACKYLAEVIEENASPGVVMVDFSDMFTNR